MSSGVTAGQAAEIARQAAPGSTGGSGTKVLKVEPGELDGKPTWNVEVETVDLRPDGEPDRTIPIFGERRTVVVEQTTGQVLKNELNESLLGSQ